MTIQGCPDPPGQGCPTADHRADIGLDNIAVPTCIRLNGEEARVVQRLPCSPPTNTTWVQSSAASLRVFTCGNDAACRRVSSGCGRLQERPLCCDWLLHAAEGYLPAWLPIGLLVAYEWRYQIPLLSDAILPACATRVRVIRGLFTPEPFKELGYHSFNTLRSTHIYCHLTQTRSESPISTTARTPVLLVSVLELTIVLLVRATPDTALYFAAFIIGRTVLDTSWSTLAQSSPPTVTADNQCTVNTGIFVRKTVESLLQRRVGDRYSLVCGRDSWAQGGAAGRAMHVTAARRRRPIRAARQVEGAWPATAPHAPFTTPPHQPRRVAKILRPDPGGDARPPAAVQSLPPCDLPRPTLCREFTLGRARLETHVHSCCVCYWIAGQSGMHPSGTPASKVKTRGSDTGDTNSHAWRLIAPTGKASSVSVKEKAAVARCTLSCIKLLRCSPCVICEVVARRCEVQPRPGLHAAVLNFGRRELVLYVIAVTCSHCASAERAVLVRVLPPLARPAAPAPEQHVSAHQQCHSWYKSRTGVRVIAAVSLLASHQGDPGSIAGRVTPDFRMWESCRTMPLVGGFARGSPVSPALSFRRCSIIISVALIGSQDLDLRSQPNLLTLLHSY
ncbi:hypothetical protein PR048_011669 [Dryococelus australis]|uniref:Uncharacterized protein n=1 Tax=Dryococelus australis TaxID=614101 RepID=A0ABQ9HMJ2_9NEOP|nr:hypothetical protein PR048_011669 [Dryococelus australis]